MYIINNISKVHSRIALKMEVEDLSKNQSDWQNYLCVVLRLAGMEAHHCLNNSIGNSINQQFIG